MTKPSLLILAAGMGSRYGGLKQISRFGPSGETIMEYSIYDAIRAGFDHVVIVLRNSFADEFREKVVGRALKKVNISFVFQELENLPEGFTVPSGRKKPWGTGHAVLMADQVIKEPFAVINADDFYGYDAYKVMCEFLSRSRSSSNVEEYCLIDYLLHNTLSESGSVARGICQVDSMGYLTNIIEHKKIFATENGLFSEQPDETRLPLTGEEHVSMNMMGFMPSIFDHLRYLFGNFIQHNFTNPDAEFFLPFALNHVINTGRAKARMLSTTARWFGVTYAEDRRVVEDNLRKLVSSGTYPQDLWA